MVSVSEVKGKKPYKIYTYEQIREDEEKFEEVYGYVRRYGSNELSYSVLQPFMNYFIMEEVGFIAYAKLRKNSNKKYVLGDPISNNFRKILSSFLKFNKSVAFVQTGEDTAKFLSEFGFSVNSLGVKYKLDVESFKVSWRVRKGLKEWHRVLLRKGIEVCECNNDEELDELKSISKEWINKKSRGKELSFLARPLNNIFSKDVRIFKAIKDGKIIAFCTFDPCYEGEKITGYALNHMRHTSNADSGVMGYIVIESIKMLKNEGIRFLHIGLAPLHKRNDSKYPFSKTIKISCDFLYNYANFLYNFKGLGNHKDRYQGIEEQTYLVTKSYFPLYEVFEILRINKVL